MTDNEGVGDGACVSSDASVQFRTTFPAICTCGIFLGLEVMHKSRALTISLGFVGHFVATVGGITLRVGGRSESLRLRLLATFLPNTSRTYLPSAALQPVSRAIQVRSIP